MAQAGTGLGAYACRILVVTISLAGYHTSRLVAQQAGTMVGVSSYRLISTGHGVAVGGYVRGTLNRSIALVGSLSVLSDHTTLETGGIKFTETLRMLFPEARIEVTVPLGRLSAFAGAGGGLGIGFGRQFGGPTLHVIGGARLALSTRLAITTAMMARAVDPRRGRTLDALVGIELTRIRK